MAAMKWWGWGLEGTEFTHEDKPALAPFIEQVIGVDVRRPAPSPRPLDDLEIPPSHLPDALRAALERVVGDAWLSTDPLDRNRPRARQVAP